MPPPSVNPATPVVDMIPPGAASPAACVAASRSPISAPGSTCATRPSTRTPRQREQSTTSAPSPTAKPATLWPPPRTATGQPRSRAGPAAATTSAVDVQRTIAAGRRSIAAFHTVRASS
jgi:hypothetical protein